MDDYHIAAGERDLETFMRDFIERAAPTIQIARAGRSLPRLGADCA